jgi:hypothetical protein
MSGERSTLVGTPVVIAPGKIFLVGEYAVLEEGVAVLAAVTRHAVAQYIPGMDAMSRVVAEAVQRARAELGDSSAALPPGSVLVNTDDFHQGNQKTWLRLQRRHRGGIGGRAVRIGWRADRIANRRKSTPSRTCRASGRPGRSGLGRRHRGRGSRRTHQGRAPKRPRRPASNRSRRRLGLHLVVFWTGQPVATTNMIEGVQKFARQGSRRLSPGDRQPARDRRKFVAELRAGSATGAVAAAGRYGRRLAVLGLPRRCPSSPTPSHAPRSWPKNWAASPSPSGAGGGDIGSRHVRHARIRALFARALPKPLAPLDVDLDRLGVRRRLPDEEDLGNSGLFHV